MQLLPVLGDNNGPSEIARDFDALVKDMPEEVHIMQAVAFDSSSQHRHQPVFDEAISRVDP